MNAIRGHFKLLYTHISVLSAILSENPFTLASSNTGKSSF